MPEGSDLGVERRDLCLGLLGRLVAMGRGEGVVAVRERVEPCLVVTRKRDGLRIDTLAGGSLGVRMVEMGLDPFPAFLTRRLGGRLEPLPGEPVEKGAVGEPASVILGEEVTKNRAAGSLVGFEPDEDGPPIPGAHMA